MKKAHIITFGCQMNEHDSARMAEVLRSLGYEMTDKPDEASLIILNTCSVRKNPENKVYSTIGTFKQLKNDNPGLIIGVGGCVAQQEGKRILDRCREVDLVFGPDNFFRLPEMLKAVEFGERVVLTEWSAQDQKVHEFIPEEWLEAGHLDGCRAYIAIMKGCNNFCSFCIVPHTRGREVCREPQQILREAKDLIQKNAKEIWLLGQNVNSYRAARYTFADLLDAVSQLDGLKRLRFTSPHPKDWNNALSDLMAARPVICKYLHLPFQAGADRILKLMHRRHTIQEYFEKIEYLRSMVPSVEISTDLIVGYPTETEEEFQQTLEVLERVRFGQVFSFMYSVRPGTRAADQPDDVPHAVKQERLQRVIAVQERINAEQLKRYVGTIQDVLIDGSHAKLKNTMNGRTDGFRPVTVKDPSLTVGDCVPVRITGWRSHWLTGERLPGAEGCS